ncbi:hypothetical protein ACX0G7_11300 [Flavitalea antarctica]
MNLTQEDVDPFKLQLKKIYTALNTEREEHLQQYKLKSKELEDKIERLEERFINEEIKADLYEKISVKFRKEREELEAMVKMTPLTNSNLEKYIDRSLDFLVELPSLWASSDYKRNKSCNKPSFPKEFTFPRKKAKLLKSFSKIPVW